MKKQTRFQTTSLLMALLLTSGIMIQSQLFSQSAHQVKSVEADKVSAETPVAKDFTPNLPEDQQRWIDAGKDVTLCVEGGNYALNGISTYAGTTYWSTSGDGEFSDPTSLKTMYQPGDYDISSGQVTLYLHLIIPGPSETRVIDAVVLSFVSCTLPNSQDDEF